MLTFLYLNDNNQITGTIPSELGLLTNLKAMDLRETNLIGGIPPEVCALDIRSFYFDQNIRECGISIGPTSSPITYEPSSFTYEPSSFTNDPTTNKSFEPTSTLEPTFLASTDVPTDKPTIDDYDYEYGYNDKYD